MIAMTTFGEAALPLPKFIKPCARNDPKLNECALSHGIPVIPQFKDGLPKYHIPVLEPLSILEIKVNQDNKGVGFNLVAKDVLVNGLSNSQMKDIRIELDPPHFWVDFHTPKVEMLGKYNIDGKVLILPIKGDGDANVTLVDVNFQYEFGGDLEKREDGKEYLSVKKTHINFKAGRTYMNLSNLFNGDEALGKRMNEFLDANWREVTEELGPPIADALAEVVKRFVEGVTDQVPFDEIFPEKV